MRLRRAARIAAFFALAPLALAPWPAAGPVRASSLVGPAPSDLTAIPFDARLPDSGHVRFVRVSTDGQLLFVGTASGALVRSDDRGHTWQDVRVGGQGGPGTQTLDLRISPADPRVVWTAGLTGVFRSTDGGRHWVEADTRGDAPGRVVGSVLALDPRHPEAAYLAGYRNGGLYRTGDGGVSWRQVIPYPVSGVAVEPASGAIIYAISRTAGVQRSTDHGVTWSHGVRLPTYTGVGEETSAPGRLLAFDGPGGGLYAAMDGGGLERSTDGGLTWQDLSAGLPRGTTGDGYAVPYDLTAIPGPHPQLYAIVPDGVLGTPSGGTLYAALAPLASTPNTAATLEATLTPTATALATVTATMPITTSAPVSATATIPISQTAALTDTMPATSTVALSAPAAGASIFTRSTETTSMVWQRAATSVDAVTAMPGSASPLLAAEAPPSRGVAATVSFLHGPTLFNVQYRLPPPSARVAGGGFAYGGTPVPYLSGINYEGPNDRPWQMWQDGKFNVTLIARDLDAASAAGYSVLRVFVQDPLPRQVLAGQFGHLDTLVALARQRDVRLLITFNDSRDPYLGQVVAVDHAIAAHLAGNPTIFGYDLQNEPGFQDIVGAVYPAGVGIPLQSTALIRRYGESVSLKQIKADRAAGKWQGPPFDHMTAQQVYVYLNVASIVDNFLGADPGYPETAPEAKWLPLLDAVNASLATYLRVQMGAVRSVDRAHLLTVGYNSYFWSAMPANELLDFRSIHLYPTTRDWSSIHGGLRFFEYLSALTRSPLVLGEYGFSTNSQSGSVASVQETAMSLYLRVLGGSGDFKWVLNDDTVGFNPYENGLGLFGAGGVPKAGYYINREMAAYFNGPHEAGGVSMWQGGTAGVGYLYAAPDALGLSGGSYSESRLRYRALNGASSAQLWMDWARTGFLRLISTHEADLVVSLDRLVGARPGSVTLTPAQPYGLHGQTFHLQMQPGVWYTLQYTPGSSVPPLAPDLPRPIQQQGWYILAAGHNVAPPFLKLWLRLGNLGDPIDEAQPVASGAVQYFGNVAMRASGGVAQLLPLGLEALGGHARPAARELPKKQHNLYFPATGHNLRAGFLRYWQSTGGAAVWGLPISEEMARGSVTAQYFTNAEFVWDGSSISLAPLGARLWRY